MLLKANTEAALNEWVGSSTWDSGQHEDKRRFYQFVNQYQKDHGCVLYESELREQIKSTAKAKGYLIGSDQEKAIQDFVSLAYKIIEFLELTER